MTLVADPVRHRTPVASRPALDPRTIPVGWIGSQRLFAGLDQDLTSYAAHVAVHGPAPHLGRDRLLADIDAAGMTGRGGAAYPVAAKVRALRTGALPAVVVNGAEGEPASAKDRVLLARAPHLVLDGAVLLADAVGAPLVVVAVTDPMLVTFVAGAITTRPDAARFEVRRVAERFIAGEARALLSALSGGSGLPPGRRVHATERGLHGAPTLLFNVETFVQLAMLARSGPAGYAATGTAGSSGTTLLSISGAVHHPGVLEVPLGVELHQVARAVGATASQAVVIGGYHGTWLAPEPTFRLCVDGLAAVGGMLGAGVVAFVGDDTCPLGELAAVADWLAGESAQQCGPCAFGLPTLAADVAALVSGRAGRAGAAALEATTRHTQQVVGRGACAHPDGSVRFIRSGLALLADEVATHQTYGTCRRTVQGHLTLDLATAMTRQGG